MKHRTRLKRMRQVQACAESLGHAAVVEVIEDYIAARRLEKRGRRRGRNTRPATIRPAL